MPDLSSFLKNNTFSSILSGDFSKASKNFVSSHFSGLRVKLLTITGLIKNKNLSSLLSYKNSGFSFTSVYPLDIFDWDAFKLDASNRDGVRKWWSLSWYIIDLSFVNKDLGYLELFKSLFSDDIPHQDIKKYLITNAYTDNKEVYLAWLTYFFDSDFPYSYDDYIVFIKNSIFYNDFALFKAIISRGKFFNKEILALVNIYSKSLPTPNSVFSIWSSNYEKNHNLLRIALLIYDIPKIKEVLETGVSLHDVSFLEDTLLNLFVNPDPAIQVKHVEGDPTLHSIENKLKIIKLLRSYGARITYSSENKLTIDYPFLSDSPFILGEFLIVDLFLKDFYTLEESFDYISNKLNDPNLDSSWKRYFGKLYLELKLRKIDNTIVDELKKDSNVTVKSFNNLRQLREGVYMNKNVVANENKYKREVTENGAKLKISNLLPEVDLSGVGNFDLTNLDIPVNFLLADPSVKQKVLYAYDNYTCLLPLKFSSFVVKGKSLTFNCNVFELLWLNHKEKNNTNRIVSSFLIENIGGDSGYLALSNSYVSGEQRFKLFDELVINNLYRGVGTNSSLTCVSNNQGTWESCNGPFLVTFGERELLCRISDDPSVFLSANYVKYGKDEKKIMFGIRPLDFSLLTDSFCVLSEDKYKLHINIFLTYQDALLSVLNSTNVLKYYIFDIIKDSTSLQVSNLYFNTLSTSIPHQIDIIDSISSDYKVNNIYNFYRMSKESNSNKFDFYFPSKTFSKIFEAVQNPNSCFPSFLKVTEYDKKELSDNMYGEYDKKGFYYVNASYSTSPFTNKLTLDFFSNNSCGGDIDVYSFSDIKNMSLKERLSLTEKISPFLFKLLDNHELIQNTPHLIELNKYKNGDFSDTLDNFFSSFSNNLANEYLLGMKNIVGFPPYLVFSDASGFLDKIKLTCLNCSKKDRVKEFVIKLRLFFTFFKSLSETVKVFECFFDLHKKIFKDSLSAYSDIKTLGESEFCNVLNSYLSRDFQFTPPSSSSKLTTNINAQLKRLYKLSLLDLPFFSYKIKNSNSNTSNPFSVTCKFVRGKFVIGKFSLEIKKTRGDLIVYKINN